MDHSVADLRLKLENLQRRLQELKAEKKRDNKLKTEDIKEVDDEIKMTLEEIDELNLA